MTFSVGQEVRCKHRHDMEFLSGAGANAFCKITKSTYLATAIVTNPCNGSGYVEVRWLDPDIDDWFVRHNGVSRGQWMNRDWEIAPPRFSPGAPVRMRDGSPVQEFQHNEKTFLRPYSAKVKDMTLSYDMYGRFYPNIDSPIDLVNY